MNAVQANILDPIHEGLPADVWNHPHSPEPKLKGQHAKWIRTTVNYVLASAGYTHMQDWLSLVLTGSLTTFQYDKHSDCDVSIFVDAEAFPEWSRAEMIGLMVEACDGLILPGTPYQMQMFVVAKGITKKDLYQPGLRSGWDIDKGKWIEPPDPTRVHDVEKEMNASYAYALEQADKMERLLRYEPDKAVTFWHQIHMRRQRDQKAGKGDYSDSNIVYKFLANRGLFPEISAASGEYIAKTAIFGIGRPQEPKQYDDYEYVHLKGEEKQEAARQQWNRGRVDHWNRAFMQDASPYVWDVDKRLKDDNMYQNLLEETYRPLDYHEKGFGKYRDGQRFYTPEMNTAWHQNYQQERRQKYLNDPSVTADDYQQWLNWYAQHAPQYFDPAGTAANAEPWENVPAAPHPKSWVSNNGGKHATVKQEGFERF